MLKTSNRFNRHQTIISVRVVEGAALGNPGWLVKRVFWQIRTDFGMKK
jgi:hypothetical protein